MSEHLYRRPDEVAVVRGASVNPASIRIYLAWLPGGPIVALDDSSAVIWLEATSGARSDLPRRVAAAFGVHPDEINDDVERFLEELLERGLLKESR